MKTKTKIESTTPRKTSKRKVKSSRKVILVHANKVGLRHFRLVSHKHTGKLIHYRNTSHAALMIVLAFVGFFLYISAGLVNADSLSSSGSVSIGMTVVGSAPTIGAAITSPKDGTQLTDQKYVTVSGTCAADMFVVVSDNNLVAGSTTCSSTGDFSVKIQLFSNKNAISALNYDNLNQSGPTTSSITVYSITSTGSGGQDNIAVPVIPSNPSIIPGVNSSISSCGDYKVGKLPTGGEPHVLIVCMPRLFTSKVKQVLGIIVWGGTTPYALSIDWGDGSEPTLLNVAKPGYYTVEFNYAVPNTYRIASYLKDANGKSSVVHASIQVNGTTTNNSTTTTSNDIFGLSWFMQSIPLYISVVAITLGFWGGDLFDRHYGSGKRHQKRRRAA